MRPLRISLVLAASAAQWACVDEARTETASAHARDSALVHDLVLAGYDSTVAPPAGRYFGSPTGARTATESSGELADAGPPSSATAVTMRNASTAVPDAASPSASAPTSSADSYIGPSCASPAPDDQQRCLQGYLARSDAQLNRSYQALITELEAESGTRAGA